MWEMFSHLRYQVVHVGRLMQPQTEESNDVREDLLCLLQTLNGKCQITVPIEFKYIYVKAVNLLFFIKKEFTIMYDWQMQPIQIIDMVTNLIIKK